MKTKQELLDFYGVEIGQRYKITQTSLKLSGSSIFTVEQTREYCGGLGLKFENSDKIFSITILNECVYEKIKPSSILDDVERKYLQKYVMDNPAFKGKVEMIEKLTDHNKGREFLAIGFNNDTIYLPYFKLDTMYKGMEENKRYTPKELGLEE